MSIGDSSLPSIFITSMSEADIDDVIEIERASFSTPWTRMAFRQEMALRNSRCMVIKKEEGRDPPRLIAYICLRFVVDQIHILNLAVAPSFRGMRLGTILLEESFVLAKKHSIKYLTLEVRANNKRAIALYKKCGF
nr:ribosomal-protein-alanine N-acetyltransferase [Desulfobacterales bacterium]